jgi:hypothetical protein
MLNAKIVVQCNDHYLPESSFLDDGVEVLLFGSPLVCNSINIVMSVTLWAFLIQIQVGTSPPHQAKKSKNIE